MTRECHVRFWERVGVRLPRATRQVCLMIAGQKHWLWRAVDQDGVVLDVLVQSRRDKRAAKRLLRKLLKKQGRAPRVMITDKLASYGAAKGEVMPSVEHRRHKGLYGAFDVKLLFQALPRCRAPSFSRVLVSSCPEIGTDRPHTSGSMGSGLATAHRDDRREARPRARIVAPQPCMRPIHVGSEP